MSDAAKTESARRLEALPHTWTVLHNVFVAEQTSHVDHLMIGPPGVFAVDSRTYANRVRVSGDDMWSGESPKTSDALTTKKHVEVLADVLGVDIPAALCIHTAPLPSIRFVIADITVLAPEGLVPWIRGRPPRLLDFEVSALTAAARQRLDVRGLPD